MGTEARKRKARPFDEKVYDSHTKKVCLACNEVKVMSSYDEFSRVCKDCVVAGVKDDASLVLANPLDGLDEDSRAAFRKFVTKVNADKVTCPHSTELVASLLEARGGLMAFVQGWSQEMDKILKHKSGTKLAMDCFYAISKLILQANEQLPTSPDLAGISDDELESRLQRVAINAMASNPDSFKEIMQDAGYRVVKSDPNLIQKSKLRVVTNEQAPVED
jgi:hypothetical protein